MPPFDHKPGARRDFGYGVPKMVEFENRSGMYLWAHEHRKRRTTPFAGSQSLNIDGSKTLKGPDGAP
ncbi:hypothetical protein EDF68_10219 [Ochrobactrum sp. BH3]|nr:hypothetical protein EDF68_10219 [Ochrobactrum sp. BH3]